MKYTGWIIIGVIFFAIRIYLIQLIGRNDNLLEGIYTQFTDLDYKVYLDATLYDSPYERHTYRYSPLLAWIM